MATWILGIDWGTKENRACLIDGVGVIIAEFGFASNGDGTNDLIDKLAQITEGQLDLVHAAIEVPRGAIVHSLMERNVNVYSLNPKKMDRFRDRFSVAGAKDDRRDAHVLADSLRTDARTFRKLMPEEPNVIELREWCGTWNELKEERLCLANRIREQLRRYFPQYLELGGDVDSPLNLGLWDLIPTPEHAHTVEESDVAALLKRHRIRRVDAAGVLEILRRTPLSVAEGTWEAATGQIPLLIARVRLVHEQMKIADGKMHSLCEEMAKIQEGNQPGPSDAAILSSIPGVGVLVLSTFLSRASHAVKARDCEALRTLSGVAPVTSRSGEKIVVGMRRACDKELRDAVYHWARTAAQRDPISKEKYAGGRRRGHKHGRALRSVADRLLLVATTMLRNRTLFSPRPQFKAAA